MYIFDTKNVSLILAPLQDPGVVAHDPATNPTITSFAYINSVGAVVG
jgi:hypothetical protein